jgi:hypothetical protein
MLLNCQIFLLSLCLFWFLIVVFVVACLQAATLPPPSLPLPQENVIKHAYAVENEESASSSSSEEEEDKAAASSFVLGPTTNTATETKCPGCGADGADEDDDFISERVCEDGTMTIMHCARCNVVFGRAQKIPTTPLPKKPWSIPIAHDARIGVRDSSSSFSGSSSSSSSSSSASIASEEAPRMDELMAAQHRAVKDAQTIFECYVSRKGPKDKPPMEWEVEHLRKQWFDYHSGHKCSRSLVKHFRDSEDSPKYKVFYFFCFFFTYFCVLLLHRSMARQAQSMSSWLSYWRWENKQ